MPLYKSLALSYVTGAHIRENNLWQTWIRDAAWFPMIYFWYENIRKYLDRRGLSYQCCQSVVGKHVTLKPACQEDPWITMRGGGGRSGAMRKRSMRWDEMIMNTNKKRLLNIWFYLFCCNNIEVVLLHCYIKVKEAANRRHVKNTRPHRWTSSSGESTCLSFLGEWWPAGCASDCTSVKASLMHKGTSRFRSNLYWHPDALAEWTSRSPGLAVKCKGT